MFSYGGNHKDELVTIVNGCNDCMFSYDKSVPLGYQRRCFLLNREIDRDFYCGKVPPNCPLPLGIKVDDLKVRIQTHSYTDRCCKN